MYTMKESVAIAKEADAKKGVSPTKSDKSVHRVRNEPERQLSSLRGVIGNIRRDGGTPSVDSFATELSGMHTAERGPVLLALQRTHGNQYVQRVVAGIQAKLQIGQPGDIYEQEADRVADEVMRMPEPQVQRLAKEEEEETVMAKEISRRKLQINDDLQTRLNLSKGGGYPLPEQTRFFMENRFGVDFSQVKVHTDIHAVQMARALNAEAFTSGRNVYFAERRYNPDSAQGKRLIAHELTHVIQQGVELRTKNRGYKNRPFHNDLNNTKKEKLNPSIVQSRLFTAVPQIQMSDDDWAITTVDRIDIKDSPAGAIGGYPDILGDSDLNVPGPFNNAATGEVTNVHQIHFHLDQGSSADLTPRREVYATFHLGPSRLPHPAEEQLPPGVAGPPMPGGYEAIRPAQGAHPDGPSAFEIQRPDDDKIVIADPPGTRSLSPIGYPFKLDADFTLTVADTTGTDVARTEYEVHIEKTTAADIPNTRNSITVLNKEDLIRQRSLV